MKDVILGANIFFAREGDIIDGVTVAVDARPDTDPTSNYTQVAHCQSFRIRSGRTPIEIWSPAPGGFELRKILNTKRQMTYVFSLQEWSELTYVEMLQQSNKPVSAVYIPGSRSQDVRGWWLIQIYDQDHNLIDAKNIWGQATIEEFEFQDQINPYQMTLRQLTSPITTAEVSNLP